MSSSLLRFEAIKQDQLDPAVLAAVEALPHPLAVSENGKVIYANRNFAQVASTASARTADNSFLFSEASLALRLPFHFS